MMRSGGSKVVAFVRAVALLAVIAVGIPVVLIRAARARFGGGAPLHGVPSPADWEFDRVRTALTDRLSDDTIADVVIRLALVVTWAAVVVIVLTVIAEVVHMVRHRGVAMPDIRGLGMPQHLARVIAAGLLVVVPLVSSPQRAIARDGLVRAPDPVEVVTDDVGAGKGAAAGPVNVWPSKAGADVGGDARGDVGAGPSAFADAVAQRSAEPAGPASFGAPRTVEAPQPASISQYVVRPGDSIYAIAQRIVGADDLAVADFAGEIVELNMGREMPDGQRFTNAAYIDVGWVLELPSASAPAPISESAPATSATPSAPNEDGIHVVQEGESLWSIAEDELGDPQRWPEIFDENEDREFDDGRSLHDPDLIQPGWELDVDVGEPADEAAAEAEVAEPSEVSAVADPVAAGPDAVAVDLVEPEAPSGPVNVWPERQAEPAGAAVAGAADPASIRLPAESGSAREVSDGGDDATGAVDDAAGEDEVSSPLVTYERAAMLSAGVLALLAVRRRRRLRSAQPRARVPEPQPGPAATERALRAIGIGDRFARVITAVRAAARPLADADERIVATLIDAQGGVELRLSGSVDLPSPWEGADDTWTVSATTPAELLDDLAGGVAVPCPTLVQLGRSVDGRDVYVDLEALEAIEVGGPGHDADAIVAAVAATLAGSLLAEVATLVGVGVPDQAFLGHRLHVPARTATAAFEAASDAIGSTAAQARSTFELRVRAEAGETWEPAVVLAGSAAGTITPPRSRSGLAVVSASPIHGPSSRLAPDGDAWELLPLGVRLHPVGLSGADVDAIAALVDVPEPEAAESDVLAQIDADVAGRAAPADDDAWAEGAHDGDLTLAPRDDRPLPAVDADPDTDADSDADPDTDADSDADADSDPDSDPDVAAPPTPLLEWALLVRLLGPVDVVSPDGERVDFERTKARELVAWLATHRERSTRSAARTALWEQDVRDATFANVVSEARRSLARLVEPPHAQEWVGRTMTDALPLHTLVRTDADLLEAALDAARVQPPSQAIATLAPAVAWIVGMPFEGTSYLWPDAEGLTSQLVLLATSASTELAAHCLSIGDIDGVFEATGRGLQVLPGHEDLIGLRMRAYARFGDHAGVRQEWESYERVINADPWSDGEPSPKLVELRRELLNPTG